MTVNDSDFTRALDKAVSELLIAKGQGPEYAEAALVQARIHVCQALDNANRKNIRTVGRAGSADVSCDAVVR